MIYTAVVFTIGMATGYTFRDKIDPLVDRFKIWRTTTKESL